MHLKIYWKTCLKIGVSAFLLFLAIHYWPTLTGFVKLAFTACVPLIIGASIAYVVNILMSSYERIYFPNAKKKFLVKSRRPVCLTAAFLTLAAIIAIVAALVVPQLISCVQLLIDEAPDALKAFVAYIGTLGILPEDIMSFLSSINWQDVVTKLFNVLSSGFGSVMDIVINAVTSVFSGIVTALVSVIFAIYILSDKDKLSSQFNRVMHHYLPKKTTSRISYVLGILNDCFRRYIIGQCTEAVILGILCAIGMLILRLPKAAMIGALIAFTALIPVAGAYIGAGVGAFIICIESPIKALIFLIFIVVLQQLEGNLIYPRVVGTSMGLPAIWVLAAVTIGGGVMGVLGMLLAVPIAATLYRILRNDMNKNAMQPATVSVAVQEMPQETVQSSAEEEESEE